MLLVLCSATDLSALWAFQRLRARGLAELELVSAEMLACAIGWEHRLSADGPSTTISLTDGRTIRSDEVTGVLNRISWIGDDQVARASPSDRIYATQELVAFYLSWMHGLRGPILNPPTPQGLCGRFRDAAEWTVLAWRAGLPVEPHRRVARGGTAATETAAGPDPASTRIAVVVGSRVVPAGLPGGIADACIRLAYDAETPLLGIDLRATPDGSWTFIGASPVPDLTLGGAELIDAVGEALTERTR